MHVTTFSANHCVHLIKCNNQFIEQRVMHHAKSPKQEVPLGMLTYPHIVLHASVSHAPCPFTNIMQDMKQQQEVYQIFKFIIGR